jgi:hypothetical protein
MIATQIVAILISKEQPPAGVIYAGPMFSRLS